ncbi:MAG TPA: DUF559 domain-containing protein [Candidatus Paceibacterota bacterium]
MEKKYKFIPYDKNLVSRARELRKEQTEAEKVFWKKILEDKKFLGLKFTRQKPLGRFIVDFYCASLRLVVEIDGNVHDAKRDKERDYLLEQEFGVNILRYRNEDILKNINNVTEDLIERINSIKFP